MANEFYTIILKLKHDFFSVLPVKNNMLNIDTYLHIAWKNDFNLWTEDLKVVRQTSDLTEGATL